MTTTSKARACRVTCLIPATPAAAYDAWINPDHPASPWHQNDELILDPSKGGFFYWLIHGNAHYGRFTTARRPGRIEHTWVSPNTLGEESTVTVTFTRSGKQTRMALEHDGLPNAQAAREHQEAWADILENLAQQLGGAE